MSSLSILRSLIRLISSPFRYFLTRFIIPLLVRREVKRVGTAKFKRITYRKYFSIPVVIKIAWLSKTKHESRAMKFVKDNTSLPVPQLYDHWEIPTTLSVNDSKFPLGCIVMEHRPGKQLRFLWPKLTRDQREHLFSQLHQCLDELRHIPQPPPVGRIESPVGDCYDVRLDWEDRFGPFRNEEEFHDWRLSTHDWQVQHGPELFRRARKAFRDDHKIVFTHGDLSRFNIHIEVDGPEARGVRVVGLLDWEMAAWMPEYWEPIKLMHDSPDEDWIELVNRMFPGYEKEIDADRELLKVSGRPY